MLLCNLLFFFFNDTATTEIYTLSLHDALPISGARRTQGLARTTGRVRLVARKGRPVKGLGDELGDNRAAYCGRPWTVDRKSTRLNSSHANISYAVFCLKKKKKKTMIPIQFISN